MDINSIKEFKYVDGYYDMIEPHIAFRDDISLYPYTVQAGEEMRPDLVMLSMYDDDSEVLSDMDVILFINGIDNPINIKEGMNLLYPNRESISLFRLAPTVPKTAQSASVTNILSTPNKTTRKDDSRKAFVDNGYSLPPVVLEESKSPVTLDNGKIMVGGIN